MTVFLKVLLGIGVAVAGGLIGLRLLLYLTVAVLAVFAAVSLNRAFFTPLSEQFQAITSSQNADVISFIILALIPLISIGYLGRRFVGVLRVDEETLPYPVNAILGSGYAMAVYAVMLCIF